MIKFTSGDLLRDESEALVNTVNCVGVMGRGIALQFKKAFPENFEAYAAACKDQEVKPGRMFVYETGQLTHPKFIVNFPTKRHWRGKSRTEDIESGLEDLARVIREQRIQSIAIPPLGSGLGGLDWHEVKARIEKVLGQLKDVRIVVYEPKGAPKSEKMVHTKEPPHMTAGRAAMIGLMSEYLNGLLDPTVSLLEVHKLMFFMQAAGEPLKLNFRKGPYGPYAENLRHVLNKLESHMITGYADGGDIPTKQLQLVPGAVEDANRFLEAHPATKARFHKVTDLVAGFETGFGLELLATVMWVGKYGENPSQVEITDQVHQWNDRKKALFSERQVLIALQTLKHKGWLPEPDQVPA